MAEEQDDDIEILQTEGLEDQAGGNLEERYKVPSCFIDENGESITLVFRNHAMIYQAFETNVGLLKKIYIRNVYHAKYISKGDSGYALFLQETFQFNQTQYAFKTFSIPEIDFRTNFVHVNWSEPKILSMKQDSVCNVYLMTNTTIKKYKYGLWESPVQEIKIPSTSKGVWALAYHRQLVVVPNFDVNGEIKLFTNFVNKNVQLPGTIETATFRLQLKDSIQRMEFNARGTMLAVVNSNGTSIEVFGGEKLTKQFTFYRGRNPAQIRSLKFTWDARHLVVSSNRPTFHVFNLDFSTPDSVSWANLFVSPSSVAQSVSDKICGLRSSWELKLGEEEEENYTKCVPVKTNTAFRLLTYCNGCIGIYVIESLGNYINCTNNYYKNLPTDELKLYSFREASDISSLKK